ncbi:MAG: hypothetical protein ACK4M6_12970 [Hyphomonas sp.]
MTDEEIERIARGFLDRTLPKSEWTHGAHFAAALWMLTQHGDAALPQMRAAIAAYNEATGGENTDTAGYHETITAASLAITRAHMAAHAGAPLRDQLASLLAGPCGRPDWILSYWSKERLFSVEARRGWLGPDLQPLPE